MAVAVVESKITDRNEITAVTSNAATADVDGLAEAFTIEVTEADDNLYVIIGGTGAAAVAGIGYSFGTGEMWNGKEISGTVAKNTEAVICVDTANCKKADGTIVLTLTPDAGDKLLTDHAAYVKVIENVG